MIERLRRLLLVVPAARARPGIPLEELARELACTPKELRKDIELLACVGAPPFSPDDLIDVEVRDDRVYVELPLAFDRPTRLSATEAAALTAAARALAPHDPVLRSATDKLASAVAPAHRGFYDALLSRFTPAPPDVPEELARTLANCSAERREVEILYFAQTELAARPRVVRPREIATANGVAYLSAQRQDGEERLYRVDRIARAQAKDTTFAALPRIDVAARLEAAVKLDARAELPRATVRFTSAVADAARARHPSARRTDTGLEASVPYSSPTWLVSYVLSWGGAATIVDPPEARAALREAVARAAAAYEQ